MKKTPMTPPAAKRIKNAEAKKNPNVNPNIISVVKRIEKAAKRNERKKY